MKTNRTYLLISISSVALLILLSIQIKWIFETAKIKKELFNEKANLVLARTTEALSSDQEACRNMDVAIGKNEIRKIDSLFTHYMNFYNIHLDYSFEVVKPQPYTARYGTGFKTNVFNKRLDEVVSKNGLELKLIFPEQKQFIIAEMGTQFITSVILILVVLVMFWYTTFSLMKEQKISQHTTEFLNNMTHEFKTPLTNIALAGNMIKKDSVSRKEDKIKHYSEIILEENEKLRLQVEQVLSMTALEKGEIPLQKMELDFHQLIIQSLKSISIQIENRQGNIELKLNAEKFIIIGDKNHLTNVLCNLIDNAVKYSKEKPELSIQTINEGNKLLVMVTDNGIGIDKEYQKQVFDKFFRVPTGNIHDVKGFGLGLAYVKKIVELHGGAIELQSVKEKGTTFTLSFPYV